MPPPSRTRDLQPQPPRRDRVELTNQVPWIAAQGPLLLGRWHMRYLVLLLAKRDRTADLADLHKDPRMLGLQVDPRPVPTNPRLNSQGPDHRQRPREQRLGHGQVG